MKKILLPILLVLLVGIGAFVLSIGVRQHRRQAIMSVITQLNAATTEYRNTLFVTRTMRNGQITRVLAKGSPALREKYITAVDHIQFVNCPDRFRIAWLNFTPAMERADNPLYLLGAMTEGAVSVVKLSPGGTQDAMARLDRINPNEAFRRVVMVALQYDVQITDR